MQWIKEGEISTKFLHKTTIAHRAHNRITKIKDSQGIELVSHSDMESISTSATLQRSLWRTDIGSLNISLNISLSWLPERTATISTGQFWKRRSVK